VNHGARIKRRAVMYHISVKQLQKTTISTTETVYCSKYIFMNNDLECFMYFQHQKMKTGGNSFGTVTKSEQYMLPS
jgi:hypothetical protein